MTLMHHGQHLPLHKEHTKRHIFLHGMLKELVVDMMKEIGMSPKETTVSELMEWSKKQTEGPLT